MSDIPKDIRAAAANLVAEYEALSGLRNAMEKDISKALLSERQSATEALQARAEKAEAARDEWRQHHDRKDHRCFELAQRAEKAEAAMTQAQLVATKNADLLAKAEATIKHLTEALERRGEILYGREGD